MQIQPVSHRGFWLRREERNTERAFRRSLAEGLGIETDIRDRDGRVVIAHDIDESASMSFAAFLDTYAEYPDRPPLALNVKSDGLQDVVAAEVSKRNITNYFMFDMSVPDLLGYRKRGLRYFTRMSEYEPEGVLLNEASGVWLDQFDGDWVTGETISRLQQAGKQVCIVSPELHGRPVENAWACYREAAGGATGLDIILCTDFPTRARDYFG